jgi:hypothetical protein
MAPDRNGAPVVATATMGYGHLRAAHPIAERLGVDVLAVDSAPLAEPAEERLWAWFRHMHEMLSKPMPFLGPLDRPARGLMDAITMIPPLHEARDHRAPTWSVRLLQHLIRRGLGRGMLEHLGRVGAPLVTTFYAPAIIADGAGVEHIFCVVTDADCNRVWAPPDAARTRIHYAAPTARVVRRLRSFGVPERNITLTGFPLPPALTGDAGGSSPEQRLYDRIARLDPRGIFRDLYGRELGRLAREDGGAPAEVHGPGPVHLMFAVGGAGAQAELVDGFLPSLRPLIQQGRLRLQLVAGTRPEVHQVFVDAITKNGLEGLLDRDVSIIGGADFKAYYDVMNQALVSTDVLWTKPSELSFYPALGIACMLSRPLGAHERYNRRWLREQGVGLKHRRLDHARGWFEEWLEDGTLAAAAWSGFLRLPKHGTERIAQLVEGVTKRDRGPIARSPGDASRVRSDSRP